MKNVLKSQKPSSDSRPQNAEKTLPFSLLLPLYFHLNIPGTDGLPHAFCKSEDSLDHFFSYSAYIHNCTCNQSIRFLQSLFPSYPMWALYFINCSIAFNLQIHRLIRLKIAAQRIKSADLPLNDLDCPFLSHSTCFPINLDILMDKIKML